WPPRCPDGPLLRCGGSSLPVPGVLLRVALLVATFRPGLLVACFAVLLRGARALPSVTAIVAPLHALGLRVRRSHPGQREDSDDSIRCSAACNPSRHALLLFSDEDRWRNLPLAVGR